MKFGYTIMYVENVIETVTFYEAAFGLKRKMVHESNMYSELETGETTLAFATDELAQTHGFAYRKNTLQDAPSGIEIGFVTEDVASAYATACEKGAIGLKEPEEKPWGQVVSYVKDLNGCIVEICSPVG